MTQPAFLGWDGDQLAFEDGTGGVMRLPAYGEVIQNAAAAERAAGRDPTLVYQRQGGAGLPAPAPLAAPAPMVPEAMPVEPVAQATTPMQTRALAYQGAGGAGSGPPTVEPVAMTTPPPPNYSTPGGPLAVEATGAPAPPPAPPPAATPAQPPTGRQLPPVAPAVRGAQEQAAEAGAGGEKGINRFGRKIIEQLMTGTPGKAMPAEWRPESIEVEQRRAPQAEIDAYNRTLAEQAALGGEVAQVRSDLADQGRQAEAQRREKNVEADAVQAAADRKAQEEDLRFEQQIDADRKALADPNHFWNDKTSGYQAAMFAFAALSGIGNVIAGKDPGDFMAGLRRVIDADIDAKKGNIGLLGEARKRARERYGDETKAREVARAAAMRQIDDQVKDLAAQSANPIVKRAVMADFPSLQEGMNFLGNEVILERNKQRAAQGQPPLTSAEEEDQRRGYVTRYLGAELEAVNAKVAAARERLGIADKYAATDKNKSKFLPARTEGGTKADPKTAWNVAKDLQEMAFKEQELQAKSGEHAAKAEEAQAKREDRDGARVFMLPDGRGKLREFIARPGTDPKTITKIQENLADLTGFSDDIKTLGELHKWKDRNLANAKLAGIKSSMVGKGTKLIGGGVVGEAEFARMNDILSATDWFTPGGVEAAQTMHKSLAAGTRALTEQVGAKPRTGGR